MQLDDGIRVGAGNLLDVDPAPGGQHQQVLLGGAVEGEAGVVLLGDVGGVLDPQPFDDVTFDVHAEDVAGMGSHLVGIVGELDAAGLAAPADLDLGLDDDGISGSLGLGYRLIDGEGDAARADRDAEAGEVLLALVFEEIHVTICGGTLAKCLSPRSALGRAVIPVLGGIVVLAAIFGGDVGHRGVDRPGDAEPTSRLAPRRCQLVGPSPSPKRSPRRVRSCSRGSTRRPAGERWSSITGATIRHAVGGCISPTPTGPIRPVP